MKFGKYIQSHQVPGWAPYYLDYKSLKKIISVATKRPGSEAPSLDVTAERQYNPDEPAPSPLLTNAQTFFFDRSPDFQAHKAAFFFKLERELEKINAFYLQKETELQLRLETLLSKRRAAALRGLPDGGDDNNSVEWSAVEEGFRLLERDLGKLQQFVELNATGFRKILKKYDKRSRTTTKEMYLARQVEVQPVFNRQLISELADTVAACLLDITDLSSGLRFEGAASTDILSQQLMSERLPHMGPFNDLEKSLRKAVTSSDSAMIYDCVRYADALAHQEGAKPNVTRILWKVIIEAPQDLADLILTSLATPFDFQFIDDINGRTCLHEAVIAGCLRLADICIEKGVPVAKADSYGRTALHYACMHGYPEVCRHLIEVGVPADTRDMDNYSPLVYATLRGSVECVRILLDLAHIPAQPLAPTGDLIPLSLACQSGHFDIALFLLQRGAKCTSNSNGEYPMHLAAREGHAQICQLLLNSEGWDLPDKYHDWTPLFHAARFGHSECVHILLEAGSRAHVLDEHGHAAAHYAAWHGHYTSMKALLAASKAQPAVAATPASSPASDIPHTVDAEIEGIPSLLLPPPIIPHRVYGHNYLDRTHLVQICLGSSLSRRQGTPAVRLRHRLISPVFNDEYLVKSTPLKLVIITTDPTVNSGPYTVPLPQVDVHEVFSFQVPSLDKLSLEMSIYPNFGTKTIGRAVALPSIFTCDQGVHQAVLPILDTRLHVVGEITFDVNIITFFEGVTLRVGGDVETYWKSLSTSITAPSLAAPRVNTGSPQTSPSTRSIGGTTESVVTISSLRGEYMTVNVQVTRDLEVVAYSGDLLPEPSFDISVGDVTLAQFNALAARLGRLPPSTTGISSNGWAQYVQQSMTSLSVLLKILPVEVGVNVSLLLPPTITGTRRSRPDVNVLVDSVLRTIYQSAGQARRRMMLTSSCPDICAALNWKQPNYPVFLIASQNMSETSAGECHDWPLSVSVDFAKVNNLLGIFVDAELLDCVPSLVSAVKNTGLLVGVIGKSQLESSSSAEQAIDICVDGNIVSCLENSLDAV